MNLTMCFIPTGLLLLSAFVFGEVSLNQTVPQDDNGSVFNFLSMEKDNDSISNNKIVGGLPATAGQFPYQVQLFDSETFQCGGSILPGRKHILTAAHCYQDNSSFIVTAGKLLLSGDGGETVPVIQFTVHPNYNSTTMENDIAVLELLRPLMFNEYQAPIVLPPASYSLEEGDVTTVSGWGATQEGGSSPDELRYVQLPLINLQTCRDLYAEFSGIEIVGDSTICAGYIEGGKDACQGDSGGPMIVTSKLNVGSYLQVGVVSWGDGCARANLPGLYTDVRQHLKFITDAMNLTSVTGSAGHNNADFVMILICWVFPILFMTFIKM